MHDAVKYATGAEGVESGEGEPFGGKDGPCDAGSTRGRFYKQEDVAAMGVHLLARALA